MCIYAVDFVAIKKKEQFWSDKSDDEVLKKTFTIVEKYDNKCSLLLDEKDSFIKHVIKLNEYHIEFRIACYREGVKKRLRDIIGNMKCD